MTKCGDSDGPLTIADATAGQGRIQLAETIEDHTQGPNLVVTCSLVLLVVPMIGTIGCCIRA